MVAMTLAAFPAAIALGLWTLRDQPPVENLVYPAVIGILLVLTSVFIFLAWPAYALWVGWGPAKSPPRVEQDLAVAFE